MPRVWIDTPMNNDVAIGGAQFLSSLMSNVTFAETRLAQMTLIRTIIGLDVARTVHDSGEGSELIGLGIGVVSQEAFAAGTVPDPLTGLDYPTRGWVWRSHYRVFGFAADQPTIFTRRIDLDLRSQRKLENGEAFFVADAISLEGVSSSIRLVGLIRQLWLVT